MESVNIPLEKLLVASGGSIYKLTIMVAKRALALADGEKPLLERPGEKVLDNALQEVVESRIMLKGKNGKAKK